jgi:hypothetical protein
MENEFLLSIATHRTHERVAGETCSILLDLLEAGDWDEVVNAGPEPSFLEVAPKVISELLTSFLEAGCHVLLHAHGNHRELPITKRELPEQWRSCLDPYTEKRISAFLPQISSDSAVSSCAQAGDSPSMDNEILLAIHGSAVSLFFGCSELRRAEIWVERAARASGLAVERRG